MESEVKRKQIRIERNIIPEISVIWGLSEKNNNELLLLKEKFPQVNIRNLSEKTKALNLNTENAIFLITNDKYIQQQQLSVLKEKIQYIEKVLILSFKSTTNKDFLNLFNNKPTVTLNNFEDILLHLAEEINRIGIIPLYNLFLFLWFL